MSAAFDIAEACRSAARSALAVVEVRMPGGAVLGPTNMDDLARAIGNNAAQLFALSSVERPTLPDGVDLKSYCWNIVKGSLGEREIVAFARLIVAVSEPEHSDAMIVHFARQVLAYEARGR